jgi:hypothetical protein
MLPATQNVSAPRRGDSKIFRGSGAVENPAPHRMAVLGCFRSTPVWRGEKVRHRRTARRVFYRRTRCRLRLQRGQQELLVSLSRWSKKSSCSYFLPPVKKVTPLLFIHLVPISTMNYKKNGTPPLDLVGQWCLGLGASRVRLVTSTSTPTPGDCLPAPSTAWSLHAIHRVLELGVPAFECPHLCA